jgi:hypothetical protein
VQESQILTRGLCRPLVTFTRQDGEYFGGLPEPLLKGRYFELTAYSTMAQAAFCTLSQVYGSK